MDSSEEEELFMIAFILLDYKRKKTKRVREIFRQRFNFRQMFI